MFKKTTLTQKQYNEIKAQSQAALQMLNDEGFQFFRDYILQGLKSVEDSILNNTVKDVKEILKVSDRFKKIFNTPKKEQIDEMVGSYKWINQFMSDLRRFAELGQELDNKIEKKQVVITDEEIPASS